MRLAGLLAVQLRDLCCFSHPIFDSHQRMTSASSYSTRRPTRTPAGPMPTPKPTGVFPNADALLCIAGAVLVEAHDEWQVSDRRYLSEGSMALLNRPSSTEEVAQPALMAS